MQAKDRDCRGNIRLIIFPYYVKNNIIIIWIVLMGMLKPVRGFYMNFYMSDQNSICGFDPCFQEIRPLVGIINTRINHLEIPAGA